VTVTQTADATMDIAGAQVLLTDSPTSMTPILNPLIGQQVYIRGKAILTGPPNQRVNVGRVVVSSDFSVISGTTIGLNDVPSPLWTTGVPWTVTAGTQTIRVTFDASAALSESNESNNDAALQISPTPIPNFSVNDISVMEGDSGFTDAIFTVSLSAPASQIASVAVGTLGIDASPVDNDFEPLFDTLTFAPRETSKTIVGRV